jgi:hypothetical protein
MLLCGYADFLRFRVTAFYLSLTDKLLFHVSLEYLREFNFVLNKLVEFSEVKLPPDYEVIPLSQNS